MFLKDLPNAEVPHNNISDIDAEYGSLVNEVRCSVYEAEAYTQERGWWLAAWNLRIIAEQYTYAYNILIYDEVLPFLY